MLFELTFIFALILLLYAKTYKYKWVIDDICVRADYLTKHTEEYAKEEREKKFQNQVRRWWITPESIAIHSLSCLVIYLLWGFKPALLWAIFPLNVHSVAWATGMRLYGTACLLLLITHYFAINFGLWGVGISCIFFFTACHTAISPIWYPLFFVVGKYSGWF